MFQAISPPAVLDPRDLGGTLQSSVSMVDGQGAKGRGWGDRWLLASCLSGLAVLGGWVPGLSLQPGSEALWQTHNQVLAQAPEPATILPEEVKNYATAALKLENQRQELMEQIGASNMAGLSCGDVGRLSSLNPAIVQYCTTSQTVVADTGLSTDRFNLIYLTQRSDSQLRLNILGEMARACIESQDLMAPAFCRDTVRLEMKKQCNAKGSQISPSVCLVLRD